VLRRRLRAPSTESLFVLTIVLFGFRLGAHSIGDNSMFLHLRTGVDMARGLGIPRVDPYSFTAPGHDWVVQSWLASWTYGVLHELGGLRLVILEQAALTGVLAWLVVRLARAGTPLRTALAGTVAVGAGAAYWTQRPLLFGLIALAVTVLAVERRWNPWWLVPIVWVWVNTHGSFPLGVAFLGARLVGEWLDDRELPSLRCAGTFAVGLVAGAINPLGPRLLTFALAVGEMREVFREVTEWRSPNFQRADGVWTLLFLSIALLILLRTRVAWRHVLPAVGFLALGLVAMRNLSPAAIMLAPALGAALRPPVAPAERRADAATVNTAFLAVLVLAFALFGLSGISGRPLDERTYPAAAARYMEQHGLFDAPHRVAHSDVVGDYLILRNGRHARVFADDRFDMYPVEVSNDVTTLIHGTSGSLDVLRKWKIDVVLWERTAPLVGLLNASGDWHQVVRRGDWVVLEKKS
jgi:hypothetical protein